MTLPKIGKPATRALTSQGIYIFYEASGKKREQLHQEKLKTLKKSGIPLSEYKKLVKKEA